jgi:hypothetical protein
MERAKVKPLSYIIQVKGAETLYQGNHDMNHKLLYIVSTEITLCTFQTDN